ncbi:Plasmodium variant antigen protein Cir/Yir/Bir, putative, partial [Plasmodium chabaudi adami]
MSKELCKAIDDTEKFVVFDLESKNYKFNDEILNAYCPNKNCESDGLKIGSAFIALLKNFESVDDYDDNLKNDKLAQYAILWLSYKIKENTKIEDGINDIYKTLIKNNTWFSGHCQYTDKNESIMKFHFTYLANLYKFLKGICETINKCNGSSNTNECIESAKKCADSYRRCLTSFPWGGLCNPYCSILSNLKKDYEKIRENNDQLPELIPPPGRENCENYCQSLTRILNAKESAIEGTKQVTTPGIGLLGQSRTLTSINNGNKLPYIAIPFILIPIILGISYK